MAYSAASIANTFLNKSFRDKNPIHPIKIQKLVYLAHGYYLALYGNPLVDELFEAWKFGPVLPSLYQECKKYSHNPVNESLHDYDNIRFAETPAPIPDDTSIREVTDFIWKTYGSMNALTLSDWTHEEEAPWSKVTSNKRKLIYRNQDISNDLIKEYFKGKMR